MSDQPRHIAISVRQALETLVDCASYGDVIQDADAWIDARAALSAPKPEFFVTNEREAFENTLKEMPNWEPEYEVHRAWVEAFAWNVWQTRALLSENSMECTTCGALVVGVAPIAKATEGPAA